MDDKFGIVVIICMLLDLVTGCTARDTGINGAARRGSLTGRSMSFLDAHLKTFNTECKFTELNLANIYLAHTKTADFRRIC